MIFEYLILNLKVFYSKAIPFEFGVDSSEKNVKDESFLVTWFIKYQFEFSNVNISVHCSLH